MPGIGNDKSSKKRKIIIMVLASILALNVYYDIGLQHEYRECRDAAIEAYDHVYNDFNLTLQGEDVEFANFDLDFALFFHQFLNWGKVYEKMVWHDQRFGDDVLTKQGLPNENMSRLKYLYWDWINAVYFGEGEIDQKMIDKLGDINWKFNCLFERWEKI